MSPPLTQEQKDNWQIKIQAFLSSGLSLKAYAKQENLVYHRLQYHVNQYRKKQATSSAKPAFQTMKVAPSANNYKVEIYFPNGIKLAFPQEVNMQHLQKIINVVLS